jgi:multidrug efflux pump subunit AcrB
MSDFENNFTDKYNEKIEKKLDKAFKKTEKSFIGFFIKNFRFTYLIIFFLVIMGVYSLLSMPKESEPEVRVPFAVVNTVYLGASPADIEELVTKKIEDKIDGLENLNRYTSSSGRGISSVFVEYSAEADLKESFRKLREAVDEAKPSLPKEVESPFVSEISFNDFPIVTFSLIGDYNDQELKKIADVMQTELENIQDVSKAEVIGGLERELRVIVSPEKLASYNLSLSQVVGAIQAGNFSLPSGEIEIDGFKYNVRLEGKFKEANEIENIVIATFDNSPVFLRDIARVVDDFKEKKTESRIGFKDEESKNTISLQLFKRTGGNILNIVEDANLKIEEMMNSNIIPGDIKIEKTNDNSVFIKEDLKVLGSSGIQTVILITIILMLILSFRGALITALAVPLAFFMAFIFLDLQDMTLNSMVLFSLVLSLGLMVDNAIIIIEGINEYVDKYKKTIYEAAMLSVWNFKYAITSGTMTTVSAFLPMLLVSGILGEYMGILPKTISVTLLSSLFVALIIIPTLAVRFIKIKEKGGKHRDKKRHQFLEKKMKVLKDKYSVLLRSVLSSRKKRIKYLVAVWLLFVIAILVPVFGFMKIEMFPEIDFDYFVINIKLPVASVMESTDKKTIEVEKIVSNIPELKNYVVNIGTSASLGFGGGGSGGSHLASITVNLIDKDDRERKSYEIAESLRPELEAVQGAVVRVEELAAGPLSGSPIEVRIFGEDMLELSSLTDKIKKYFESVDGVINIKDSFEDAAGEFVFRVDKQKANYYGLSVSSIASTLRNAVYGSSAGEVSFDGDDVDINVKYDKASFRSVSDLENLLIFLPGGGSVPIKELAEINLEPSLLSIEHRDGKRIATVSADIRPGENLQNILKDFDDYKNSIFISDEFSIKVGGETEEITKSFTELFYSMILAIILIAFILVLQFNSFKQPFIIILSLPLAIIGVIIGLNIFKQPFGFPVFIGMVSLSGIVVNDAIVLIDRINKNIKNGMEFIEAIIDGGLSRMQPIFLTTLTTIAGIAPLIYANELWRGLSLTVIFGLIFSTILILVIIPIYYVLVCKKEYERRRKKIEREFLER